MNRHTPLGRMVAVLALGGAAACGGGATVGIGQPPKPETHSLQLRSFSSCGALEKFIEDRQVEEMSVAIETNIRNGVAYADSFGGVPTSPVPGVDSNKGPTIGRTSGPAAYTKTNLQTEGVDEADFVKNDGKRIFVLSGQRLYVTRSWPAQDLALTSGLEIEGQPAEMFLDEKNRVVVISQVYDPVSVGTLPGGTGGGSAGDPALGEVAPCFAGDVASGGGGAYPGCGSYGPARTKLTVVDVTNSSAPAEIAAYYLPGQYAHARRVGASVRVVLTDYLPTPPDVRYYPDSTDSSLYQDKARLRAAMDALRVRNETIIRGQTLDHWIRTPRIRRAGASAVELGYRCEDFNWSSAYTRSGLVTVATLNLDATDDTIDRTVVLSDPGLVYASKDALYLATPHWWWWPEAGQTDLTYVYKFNTTDPSRAVFTAAGFLEGHIVNQFSLDEYEGFLRAAVTIQSYRQQRSGSTVSLTQTTTNKVVVLAETAGTLSVWGQSEELASGETIQSARFLGKRGFVVTFRQTDPLFTIDLSDPAKPHHIGELKVPGFSTYLHPMDDNHLLAIGVYVPDTAGGPTPIGTPGIEPAQPPAPDQQPPTGTGGSAGGSGTAGSGVAVPNTIERALKLTIFDVTDFANPKEAHTVTVGTSASQSEALYEHKAFNYFARERGLLAIPFADYAATRDGTAYWDSFVSELRVFKVDVTNGIVPVGAVSMKDVYRAADDAVLASGKVAPGLPVAWPAYYTPWIRRSVMATDMAGNDFIYAISDAGIRVASGMSLAQPLATALFPLPGY